MTQQNCSNAWKENRYVLWEITVRCECGHVWEVVGLEERLFRKGEPECSTDRKCPLCARSWARRLWYHLLRPSPGRSSYAMCEIIGRRILQSTVQVYLESSTGECVAYGDIGQR